MKFLKLAAALITLLLPIGCVSSPKLQTTPKAPVPTQVPGVPKEPKPISVRVYPENAFAGVQGATIGIYWRVEQHPDNREYMVRWSDESVDFGGRGKYEMNEDDWGTMGPFFLDRLGPGKYKITATLIRVENGEKKRYTDMVEFEVH